VLKVETKRFCVETFEVYGVNKVWHQFGREKHAVASGRFQGSCRVGC
jgi:hypothetical protein